MKKGINTKEKAPAPQNNDIKNQLKNRIAGWLTKKREQTDKPDFYRIGDEIEKKRYLVLEKLGQGGFGQVYLVADTVNKTRVALKVEEKSSDQCRTDLELKVLQSLQSSPHCPKLYSHGAWSGLTYVSMQRLGKNLSTLRRECSHSPNRLSVAAAYACTAQGVKAVEALHNAGYIHRDIKPSNFLTGYEATDLRRVYIIDFGLCKYFMRSGSNQHRSQRPDRECGFRGTVRYASLAAHLRNDLSRRDDMWMLFYQLIELVSGQLPWRSSNDKREVGEMKKVFPPEAFCAVLPPSISVMVQHIRSLRFDEKPRYNLIVRCLEAAANSHGISFSTKFDWQLEDCVELTHWTPPGTSPVVPPAVVT